MNYQNYDLKRDNYFFVSILNFSSQYYEERSEITIFLDARVNGPTNRYHSIFHNFLLQSRTWSRRWTSTGTDESISMVRENRAWAYFRFALALATAYATPSRVSTAMPELSSDGKKWILGERRTCRRGSIYRYSSRGTNGISFSCIRGLILLHLADGLLSFLLVYTFFDFKNKQVYKKKSVTQ